MMTLSVNFFKIVIYKANEFFVYITKMNKIHDLTMLIFLQLIWLVDKSNKQVKEELNRQYAPNHHYSMFCFAFWVFHFIFN